MQTPSEQPLGRAQRLEDVAQKLDPKPLVGEAEMKAFYRSEVNGVRGDDPIKRMALGLERAWKAPPYKAFMMGHSGVGKSTELTRLLKEPKVASRFLPIRFSVTERLDPIGFKPFDLVLVMMDELVTQMSGRGLGKKLPDALLKRLLDWFAEEKRTVDRVDNVAVQVEAGAGVGPDGLLAKVIKIFGQIRGEARFSYSRKKEIVEYRLRRLDELIDAANSLLTECNRLATVEDQREWLFVVEDFDKAGVSPTATKDLFVNYANVIRNLATHVVITIPVALGYSSKAAFLPVSQDKVFTLVDTMVFDKSHQPHSEGRAAVRAVLEARVAPGLFAVGEMERLIVASGGNLRDLFALASSACDRALLRDAKQAESVDVTRAISELRTSYERRLGDGPFDDASGSDGKRITYESKAVRLLRIYEGDEAAKIPDDVLYSLLLARAVQEFNGERWFGVHPLVVDVLERQGRVSRQEDGTLAGGTS